MPDQKEFRGATGGRKRAQVIDKNVSAMAGGGRAPLPGSAVRSSSPPRRQPAQPSSYAPSGEPPVTRTFGTPLQEGGKPRGQTFAEQHAAELRNSVTQQLRGQATK